MSGLKPPSILDRRFEDRVFPAIVLDRRLVGFANDAPEIVCLCGSTRFMDHFFEAGWQFTLRGKIVLSVGVAKHQTPDGGHVAEALGGDVAERLDELHFRKIELADRVFVLNVGGYIGPSTRREINYARALGKPIGYLESVGDDGSLNRT